MTVDGLWTMWKEGMHKACERGPGTGWRGGNPMDGAIGRRTVPSCTFIVRINNTGHTDNWRHPALLDEDDPQAAVAREGLAFLQRSRHGNSST